MANVRTKALNSNFLSISNYLDSYNIFTRIIARCQLNISPSVYGIHSALYKPIGSMVSENKMKAQLRAEIMQFFKPDFRGKVLKCKVRLP